MKPMLNLPGKQSGITMIEILVTLIILLFGLLGLAGLQMQGLRSEMESYQRVQALILLQDMVGRINANRGNKSQPTNCTGLTTSTTPTLDVCEWGNIAANVNGYVASNIGTGDAQPADCTALAIGRARDICEWSNALKGTSEKSGATSVGAMIGARGCIRLVSSDTTQISVQVSVAWQGMGATLSQTTDTCGQGSYGSNDALRRVVNLTIRIANLTT